MTTGSEGIKERANKALTSQEQGTVTLLSSLLAVQDELGYIPEEAIEEVARFTQYTINDVWGVASFYPNFRFEPPGVHSVELCWGPSCHIVGAMPVVKAALETLGLNDEGDTPDGRVTVRYNTCLGACSQGPVISIDHELIGRASPDRVREMMLSLGAAKQGVHQHSQPPGEGNETAQPEGA